MNGSRQSGFTLVELLIGLAIVAILLAMAAPSFSRWIQSSQIRTSAEALQNGLMLARAEAVRRNTNVRFQLTTEACVLSDSGTGWAISIDDITGKCGALASDSDDPRIIQVRSARSGSPNVAVNAGGVSLIVFNGMGQTTNNIAAPLTTINISNPIGGTCAHEGDGPMRCLRVTVSTSGQVRMCDPHPNLPADDPRRC